jgi:hypothetical protein
MGSSRIIHIPLLVNRAVVAATQHREVRERSGPALGPVANVMALAEGHAAALEATPAVAMVERAPDRRWDRTCAGADFDDATLGVVPHQHPARVARQPAGRYRGNVRAAFEDRLAGRVGVRENRLVDVDDDLVTLAWSSRIEIVVEGALGDQGQRIGPLLSHRGRVR